LFLKTLNVGVSAAEKTLGEIKSHKQEEKKGVTGLFNNSKIKQHNSNVEQLLLSRQNYVDTLKNILDQVNK